MPPKMPPNFKRVTTLPLSSKLIYLVNTIIKKTYLSDSHGLNPVNYIWAIIQQRVYQTKVQDVYDLRQRLIDVCTGVEQK